MKTSKSPENTEVTPSKKKLMQARLPFKLISEPSPITQPTRKRKLSAAEPDIASKVGKLTKENEIAEHSVIISDEEKDDETKEIVKPPLNPYVKLVDTVWKKKLKKQRKGLKRNSINSSSTTKHNDSMSSNPSTPKHNKSLSTTNSLDDSMTETTTKHNKSLSTTNSLDDSMTETTTANLTPKQKKLEAAKKREEREKEKQDKDKKRQLEKEEKAKQRQDKEELKRKEREEKEESKRKEKEEKEKQKELEKKMREEKEEQRRKEKEEKEELRRKEKEEKEEQRKKEKEAKEEEKRKKQEALELEKQEQELKKKKAAEAFVNFFVPKQKSEKDQSASGPVSKSSVLSSFTIKSDMRLAPTIRVDLTEEKKHALDNLIEAQSDNALYLKNLKDGNPKPLGSGKTWPLSDKNEDDDVMIVEDELPLPDVTGEILTCDSATREKLRPKLLSFHDNRRPPYWGTFRKKSTTIKPRRPFGQDEKHLDYEVDSDEEWEEEQEGESIDGSAAGSEDEQDADEYEVDNEVFVPHGYLSDEEATMDDDDVLSLSPESQKTRLKHLEDEFESEMKKPTEKLKPRLYGILWETPEGGKPENCVDALWNYFQKWSMIMGDPTPLFQPSKEPEEVEKKKVKRKKITTEGENESPKIKKKEKSKPDNKEPKPKTPKNEIKPKTPDTKKNQPGINTFLKKMKSS